MPYRNGAYIVERGGRRRGGKCGGAKRAAAALIIVLLVLSAVICLLVVFLPKTRAASSSALTGKTFYFLATAEEQDRAQALLEAQYAAERGGAGYIYNDGSYRVIAAVYARETDVKTLVSVNTDSYYFSLAFAGGELKPGDRATVEYLLGEWFDTTFTAATELDRGNVSEAAAEHAVADVTSRLARLALSAESDALKTALSSVNLTPPATQTLLSYIRYVHVNVVLRAYEALNA